jgi:hypothetical protein
MPYPHPPLGNMPPFFKNQICNLFSRYGMGSVFSIYKMLTKKIRIRKSSYEILVDLIYRIELNLLGKKKEFGKLQPSTAEALSNLLSAARAAKIELERNCLQDADFTSRSKELNAVVGAIEALIEAKVLDMAAVKA